MKSRFVCGALLALLGAGRAAHALEVEVLRDSGPVDKRFNIAVLGDGYRTQDQAKLKTDAQGIIGYLFGVTPLKQYGAFFNVKLLHVISTDNGADNGAYGTTRDTALDSYFNCGGIDRLLCVDGGKANTLAAEDIPEFNFAVVIVNDTKYGGSGGAICASSSNESSFEVMAHEIGHSLARLADEYDYEGNQQPCNQQQDCREANVTLRNALDQVKWKDWIDAGTQLPTPETNQFAGVIGLFEGARYQTSGIYRPKLSCKMKDLGTDYCSVCTEQFVRSIWSFDNIQMIEGTTPAQSVEATDCDPVELKVATPTIAPSSYRFTWTVDGKAQLETKETIVLAPGALMQGTHQVGVLVEDTTELVRSDPEELLKDQYSWSINVARSDCPVVVGGAGGSGGVAGGGAGGALAGAGGALGGAGGTLDGNAGAVSGGAGGALGGVAGSSTGPPSAPAPPPQQDAGCGCSVPGQRAAPALAPLALLALAFGARRRRLRGHVRATLRRARRRCAPGLRS